MSAWRDPRRKSFFDTPSHSPSNNGSSDGEGSSIPRRKKRIRRVSAGASTIFTTDDGFQYRRRQTLIHPKFPGDIVNDSQLTSSKSTTKPGVSQANKKESGTGKGRSGRSPKDKRSPKEKCASKGNITPESSAAFSNRLTDSSKFKKIPKKIIESLQTNSSKDSYPEYPDTSEWSPPMMPSNDESSAEMKLLSFLKHLVSFEICQASCVYLKDEHKFIQDRIESVCKAFLAKANELVLKIMDETGPLKKLKTLPNPANIALLEKQKTWSDVIAASQAELFSWNELKHRPLIPESNVQEPELKLVEYLKKQNLHHLLEHVEYHEPILKGFLSISVKADNIFKAAQASSQVLSDTMQTQESIAKWVTQRSLKPMQKIVDPQAALLNVMSSNIH